MYCKEVLFLALAYTVPIFAIKIEPRYNYPIRLEDSEYAVPGLAKSIQRALILSGNKLQKGSPIVHEPHVSRVQGKKYFMVVKSPHEYGNYDAGRVEESDVASTIEKTEESLHVLLPNPIINKKQVVSFVLQDPEGDDTNEFRLPKAASRHPRIKQKIQEIETNDGDDDLFAYRVHEVSEPKTYKLRKERTYRNEKRIPSARIKANYSFPGSKGRTTIVKYTASPEGGYRIEEVQ